MPIQNYVVYNYQPLPIQQQYFVNYEYQPAQQVQRYDVAPPQQVGGNWIITWLNESGGFSFYGRTIPQILKAAIMHGQDISKQEFDKLMEGT